MNMDFSRVYQAIRQWATTAYAAGWLSSDDIDVLDKMETASAQDLFTNDNRRPLIVGLFGGTGVGKSSLLNRLAGHAIAEVGVARPTSKRATIYLHESQSMSVLPEHSPAMHTDIKYHGWQDKSDVAWLDMPDIDSVERSNRELALAWLPYIDWLIYVTSPERYRDDVGWRLVKQRHHRHHWLFVINHWDQASESQLDEFLSDLESAGFTEPKMLRTSCANQIEDDFEQLEKIIDRAIREHGLTELQRIGVLAKLEELRGTTYGYVKKIGTKDQWQALRVQVTKKIRQRLQIFKDRLESDIEGVAQYYPAAPALWRADPKLPKLSEIELEQVIWSNFCDHLIENVSADAVITVEEKGISSEPLSLMIQQKLASTKKTVLNKMNDGLKNSFAGRGIPMRRFLRRGFRFLSYALPTVVGVGVLYNVATQYQQGLTGEKTFLGIDFAVHSLLLIGMTWFIPFLLSRWLRSSPRATARRGLRSGLKEAVEVIERDLLESYDILDQHREQLIDALPEISAD